MKDIFSIKGKVALVTGGSRGIGSMIAAGFLSSGAKVYISSRKADACDETAKKLSEEYGGECISIPADVSNVEGIEALADAIKAKEDKLDILINNAGIALPTSIDNDDFEVYWDKTHNVLLKGQAILIRECLPFIEKSNTPRIVNISSTEGLGASPMHSPYTSAKHGVIGLTRSLAVELGKKGITVNCICPGPINTAMTEKIPDKDKEIYSKRRVPLRRYGDPEEVAHATLNFCLPSSSFITGAVLAVDGGLTIKRA